MSGKNLAKKVRQASHQGVSFRQGTVTAFTPGSPNKVSATIGGVTFTNIPVLKEFSPTVGVGAWFVVMGDGKMLGIGTV